MRKNAVIVVLAVILTIITIYQFGYSKSQQGRGPAITEETIGAEGAGVLSPAGPKVGLAAPSFSLTGLDGKLYQVGGVREKPLLLNFWASWCGPCEEEAPELAEVYNKYKDRFDLYAVNMTTTDEEEDARAFVRQYGFGFPVLMDREGDAGGLYKIIAIPTSYLIGTDGTVEAVFNSLEPGELTKKVKKFVEQQEKKRE